MTSLRGSGDGNANSSISTSGRVPQEGLHELLALQLLEAAHRAVGPGLVAAHHHVHTAELAVVQMQGVAVGQYDRQSQRVLNDTTASSASALLVRDAFGRSYITLRLQDVRLTAALVADVTTPSVHWSS